MNVTPEGIVTEERLLQSENAMSPIDVTLSGIVTDVKLSQPWNALSPMAFTECPPSDCGIIDAVRAFPRQPIMTADPSPATLNL